MTAQSVAWVEGVYWGGSNEFTIKSGSNGLTLKPTGDAVISGNLDVGTTGNNSLKKHGTGVATSYAAFTTTNGYNYYWGFQNGNHSQAWSNISVKGSSFMSFSYHDITTIHTRSLANWTDDRLKENEICIENACETLPKLRPQLYQKTNMENNDSITWAKESGLIAQ